MQADTYQGHPSTVDINLTFCSEGLLSCVAV